MFLFGVVSGGIWMGVGIGVLVVTLLYWGREALRDYDRTVHADALHEPRRWHPARDGRPHAPARRPHAVALVPPAAGVRSRSPCS